MRTYLKAVLMIVLLPSAVIAGSVMAYLWCEFAISLDLPKPVRFGIYITPVVLLAAIPVAWVPKKLEEKH
ncbi:MULTISPECIES: hypothetical protein [Pseudomonas]|uniref:hypothetical protein n=1 Tax=Pseudomonas TaxID=286 RepID=UPI002248BC90|nr:hypothetical protein [Pseudomonas sp. DCB_BG]MCX2706076.1 hypothetical protein [Pseudomonas sp. DCB_BG]